MEGIAYTIIGGLAVLALVWFWNDPLPRILQRFYHHEPTIAGRWKTTFRERDRDYHETVSLKQKGRRVKGEIVLREPEDETTIYRFEGTFKYLMLRCTYESTDPGGYEQGAFALRYTRHQTFEGQYILLSRESEQLISSDYVWERH